MLEVIKSLELFNLKILTDSIPKGKYQLRCSLRKKIPWVPALSKIYSQPVTNTKVTSTGWDQCFKRGANLGKAEFNSIWTPEKVKK